MSAISRRAAAAAAVPLLHQVGQDIAPQLLALLARATALLTPDSGPAHMGTLAGVPVIGLRRPRPRSAAVRTLREWCVDAYSDAALRSRPPAEDLAWTEKIENPASWTDRASLRSPAGSTRCWRAGGKAQAPPSCYDKHERHTVPISPGELLDKITIRIRSARMNDAAKLENVRHELALLEQTWTRAVPQATELATEEHALETVNTRLWDIEDRIREHEAGRRFDASFIELARAVYVTNDERAAIKKRINVALGSKIVEEKSYRPYT
jgi:hypothetical protein